MATGWKSCKADSRADTDFGIHPVTLTKWKRAADVEAGIKPATSTAEFKKNRDLKRRARLLEQENETLRRAVAYLSQPNP